jgi:hypothetical protein
VHPLAEENRSLTNVHVSTTQVLLIGDAAPNTDEQIIAGRARHGQGYWSGTRFARQTAWANETVQLADNNVKCHTFHLIPQAGESFAKIAGMTGGKNRHLDVHGDNAAGHITECVTTELLRDIGGDDFVAAYHAKFGYAGGS